MNGSSSLQEAISNGESHAEEEIPDAIPSHPLGVKPSGNSLTATWNLRTSIGSVGILPDELILTLLETLDSRSLRNLGATCKALYAFTRSEELWKALVVEESAQNFTWRGTWHSTYLNLPASKVASPDCSQLFSDTLHRPFYCAHANLANYAENIPGRNRIPKLSNLSAAEFEESWANRPFILTEPVKEWPAFKEWSMEHLTAQHANTMFRDAEAVNLPLNMYVDYMNDNSDDRPLYLFDKGFVNKMGLTVEGKSAVFSPPACFGEDYFGVLGSQRPDHEWLIIGPERSGSSFHKDPNATSAWNAVLRGEKYWVMFPGSTSPPGVYVSAADQAEVTAPLGIAEWLLNFHAAARKAPACMEGICGEGEVLYVPSGWWHLVVNLTPAIAVTQNFVTRKHLGATLEFLKYKPDQVSGFKKDVEDPYRFFVERMQEAHSDLLETAVKEMEGKRKRKWDEIVHGSHNDEEEDGAQGQTNGGFSFGFGDDGSDVEVP